MRAYASCGALLLCVGSAIDDRRKWTPSIVKQALIEGAQRLSASYSIFEQGAGKMNLLASYHFLQHYRPMITYTS